MYIFLSDADNAAGVRIGSVLAKNRVLIPRYLLVLFHATLTVTLSAGAFHLQSQVLRDREVLKTISLVACID